MLGVLLLADAVSAQPADEGEPSPIDECIDAAGKGQELRDAGRLLESRQAFLTCTRSVCPKPVRDDCEGWLEDVKERVPTVIIRAKNPQGKDLAKVRVLHGERVLAEELDGVALELDPGSYQLRFEHAGFPTVSQTVVIREREQSRFLDVTFELAESAKPPPQRPPAPVEPAPPAPGVPAGAWVLGGVGVVGGGVFAWLASEAKSERDNLRRRCAPECSQSDVDAAQTKLLIANISLGVGVLALGGALWLALDSSAPKADARDPVSSVGIAPALGGGVALYQSSF